MSPWADSQFIRELDASFFDGRGTDVDEDTPPPPLATLVDAVLQTLDALLAETPA